jgi:hypothetical protein
MTIKPYLQLVRLPNVFTAAADSLAGWLLVRGNLDDPARWLPLVLASMSIYAAGIVLNDWFDIDLDREERPGRPLPSGRVSPRFALNLGAGLLVSGPALAAATGSRMSLVVALLLSGCVMLYDAALRRTVLGPEVMGCCRGLNVLLGMSQSPAMGGPTAWLVAASMGVFVTGVTWISRSETKSGQTVGVAAGMALEYMAILGLLFAALRPRQFPTPRSDMPIVAPEGLLVLLVVGLVISLVGGRALRNPTPATIQRSVKTGVFSLIWLNVGMVLAVRGVAPALAVAVLWIPAFVLGRWLYST